MINSHFSSVYNVGFLKYFFIDEKNFHKHINAITKASENGHALPQLGGIQVQQLYDDSGGGGGGENKLKIEKRPLPTVNNNASRAGNLTTGNLTIGLERKI